MRKPKDYSSQVSQAKGGVFIAEYIYNEEIPRLIKWLEKVYQYNEFNTKKKAKPTTTKLLTTTKISRKVK